jgi:hypothetical protein
MPQECLLLCFNQCSLNSFISLDLLHLLQELVALNFSSFGHSLVLQSELFFASFLKMNLLSSQFIAVLLLFDSILPVILVKSLLNLDFIHFRLPVLGSLLKISQSLNFSFFFLSKFSGIGDPQLFSHNLLFLVVNNLLF